MLLPLILCIGGLLAFALLDGKASEAALVAYAVGLWYLVPFLASL